MTGCATARAARDRYREVAAQCPTLAYGLHQRGDKCRRLGGPRQCGECAGDLVPSDMPKERMPWPLSGGKRAAATAQRVEDKKLCTASGEPL